ncbi:394_t:CDS:1 [Funneliformis caledonium]|uniref:394_t:CDS:1 n=1 Tax=Funneliformis caledonium TaxID=1117310 RepID=A0A9N9AKH6_9GLOM|nr:394_t:CDS:1 [Funneliformis caledonium]
MITKIFILLFFIFIVVVKTELPPASSVRFITMTKNTVAQPSNVQSLHTTSALNHEFNSLPGNPDPAQVKVVYYTTIKHTGIKSKLITNSTTANANENSATNMFILTLIVPCIAVAMFGLVWI